MYFNYGFESTGLKKNQLKPKHKIYANGPINNHLVILYVNGPLNIKNNL